MKSSEFIIERQNHHTASKPTKHLYHGTSVPYANQILYTDTIKDMGAGFDGVSLTRDPKVALGFATTDIKDCVGDMKSNNTPCMSTAGVILVLNRAKLLKDFELEHRDEYEYTGYDHNEFEEAFPGTDNLSKYIDKIIIVTTAEFNPKESLNDYPYVANNRSKVFIPLDNIQDKLKIRTLNKHVSKSEKKVQNDKAAKDAERAEWVEQMRLNREADQEAEEAERNNEL